MKIKYLVIVLLILVALGFGIKLGKGNNDKVYDNTPDPKDAKIEQQTKLIDKLTKEKQDEEIRKARLLALQNPEIIYKECQETGQIIVYKSNTDCSAVIKENSFWGSKTLDYKLNFNFGITYDLNLIEVDTFYEDTVVVKINKNNLVLQYVELNLKDSKVKSTKSWLSKQFNAQDEKIIIEQATEKTRADIFKNRKFFDDAMTNLTIHIKSLARKLGFRDAVVEII